MKYFVAYALIFMFLVLTKSNTETQTNSQSETETEADIFIDVNVVHNTKISTISEFSIDNGKVTGYFMERPAGSQEEERTAGSKKRIPPGTYQVIENDCNRYRRTKKKRKHCGIEFRLVTNTVPSAGTRDLILIHTGNLPKHTTGCLLPGDNYALNAVMTIEVFDRKTRTYKNETITSDKVGKSYMKLKQISDYVDKRIRELKQSGKNDITMKIRLR